MFAYLFFALSSSSKEIDRLAYISLVQEHPELKFFLFLHDPNCLHCRAAHPAWNDFAKEYDNIKEVYIGEVNCLANGDICSKYADNIGYPQWVYLDRANDIISHFNGKRTKEGFANFLVKKLGPPVTRITSNKELNLLIKQEKRGDISDPSMMMQPEETSIILLRTDDVRLENKYIAIAYQYDTYKPLFLIQESEDNELLAISDSNLKISFNRKWTKDNMADFINKHRFKAFPLLTSEFLKYYTEKIDPLIVFVLQTAEEREQFEKVALTLQKYGYQATYTIYHSGSYLARLTNIKEQHLPCLVSLKTISLFKLYRGILYERHIIEWVQNEMLSNANWEGGSDLYNGIQYYANSLKSGDTFSIIVALVTILLIVGFLTIVIRRATTFSHKENGLLFQQVDVETYKESKLSL